jgi:hypothetical protein
MSDDRPTPEQKADAVMRLADELDAASAAIHRATRLLREGQKQGASGWSGPLFPYCGDSIFQHLDKARDLLWNAKKIAAPQYLEAQREIAQAPHHGGDQDE